MALDYPASPTVGQIYTSGGTSWMWDGQLWNAVSVPPSTLSNPNKLLNPFMEIDQANEGAAIAIAAGSRTIDGFQAGVSATGGSWVGGRTNGIVPGYTYALYLQTGGTAASAVPAAGYGMISAQIEADDIQDTQFGTANARPLTLSFWARCSISGTYYAWLANNGSTRTYAVPFTITTANVSQFFSITFPGDTAGTWAINGNTLGMAVGWTLGSGTNYQGAINTWNATQILAATGMSNAFLTTANALFILGPCKLEVGSVATPMLRQSFQQELARCQRYYEKSYAQGTAVGNSAGVGNTSIYHAAQSTTNNGLMNTAYFAVEKRATPTMTTYSGTSTPNQIGAYVSGAWTSVAPGAVYHNTKSAAVTFTNSATTLTIIGWEFVADARL